MAVGEGGKMAKGDGKISIANYGKAFNFAKFLARGNGDNKLCLELDFWIWLLIFILGK